MVLPSGWLPDAEPLEDAARPAPTPAGTGTPGVPGSDKPSHVLTALGLPAELARTAVRFTFGPASTEREADQAAEAVRQAVNAVRGLRAAG